MAEHKDHNSIQPAVLAARLRKRWNAEIGLNLGDIVKVESDKVRFGEFAGISARNDSELTVRLYPIEPTELKKPLGNRSPYEAESQFYGATVNYVFVERPDTSEDALRLAKAKKLLEENLGHSR